MKHIQDSDADTDSEHRIPRRALLKFLAAAPLALPFAFSASPLMRFLKPTTQSFSPFQKADIAKAAKPFNFTAADFPKDWTCIPFNFELAYVEFNPEERVVRNIPSYIIRIPGRYVAYSRHCPYPRCKGLLEYVTNRIAVNCGCAPGPNCCCVSDTPETPVLFCRIHESVFDIANQGKPAHGCNWIRPRELELSILATEISVVGLQYTTIG
jgi:hypothetical protein